MPKAVFVSPDGSRTEIEVTDGTSLMQAAVSHWIDGIVGDCGGSASCATCHVYVDEPYLAKIPPPTVREAEMLECVTAKSAAGSRLSCQILMAPELDGITIRIAERQW